VLVFYSKGKIVRPRGWVGHRPTEDPVSGRQVSITTLIVEGNIDYGISHAESGQRGADLSSIADLDFQEVPLANRGPVRLRRSLIAPADSETNYTFLETVLRLVRKLIPESGVKT
jgi:hypothetical protein